MFTTSQFTCIISSILYRGVIGVNELIHFSIIDDDAMLICQRNISVLLYGQIWQIIHASVLELISNHYNHMEHLITTLHTYVVNAV